ncbi:hypothetical protein [Umezawaea beigongshangensis]|uniref:hypothetical protein n=1 Tax=Umezawaea beigongshangensis TaxID=2780383 RepID=UPI0018F152B1|nr:hypothetical protein [Umezawaea beigongshangensis]
MGAPQRGRGECVPARTARPRLLGDIEPGGWPLLGFEHVSGQHADLSPGSSDLPLIADAVRAISRAAASPRPLIRLTASGHDPDAAEKWAHDLDGFAAAPLEEITAFAASVLRVWERGFAHTPATSATRRWARCRVARTSL